MSKRGAQGPSGDDERYGGYAGQSDAMDSDKPMHATAAQMARRKIAGIKGRPKARSQSPATTGSIFGDAQAMGFSNPGTTNQAPNNAFNSAPPASFSFGSMNNGAATGTPGTSFNSTPSFTFGASNNQAQQQPQPQTNGFGGSSTSFSFGSNKDSGASSPFVFGNSQTQPTQPSTNGFNPPTSSLFSQQSQSNGNSPNFFGGSQPAAPAAKPASTSFGGFGSQNAQDTSKSSTTSFGSNFGGQTADPKPAASNGLFSFGKQDQQNGDKSSEAPKQASTLFGATFPQPSSDKPDDKPKANGFLPSTSSIFGPPAKANGDQSSDSSSKPNMFGGFGNGSQPNNFGDKTSQPSFTGFNHDQDASMVTPEGTPQKGLFGQTNGVSKSADAFKMPSNSEESINGSATPKAAPSTGSGSSLFDRISREPPKSNEAPGASSLFAPKPSTSETPVQSTKSLFSAPPASAPSKSLFNNTSSFLGGASTPNTDAPKALEAPATGFKASEAYKAPQSTLPAPISKALFAPTTQQPSTSHGASALSGTKQTSMDKTSPEHFQDLKQLNQALLTHLKSQRADRDWSSVMECYIKLATDLQGKPAKAKAIQSAPAQASTSNMFSAAAQPAAPKSTSASGFFGQSSATDPVSKKRTADEQLTKNAGDKRFAAETIQTPKATNSAGFFGQPPATAPVNKRPAEQQINKDGLGESETSQRRKSDDGTAYPKLPENASNTAKLFEAALDKPSTKTTAPTSQSLFSTTSKPASLGFTPSASFQFGNAAGSSDSKPADDVAKPASSGFTPSQPATSGFKPTGFTPSLPASSGFKPTGGSSNTGSGGWLSSFGQKAQKEAEKEKQKRKDEDFDSEEDDPEEWEKKYQEEQIAIKNQIEAKAKSFAGFQFKTSDASKAETAKESDKPVENKGGSLFDRISKPAEAQAPAASSSALFSGSTSTSNFGSSIFGGASKTTSAPTSNLFNFSKPDQNKDATSDDEQAEDHTWKQGTPIKFGGQGTATSTTPSAPPPKFSGLFGAPPPPPSATSNGSTSIFASAGTPGLSFSFGAKPTDAAQKAPEAPTSTSKAGEEAGGDDEDAAPKEAQIEDMTALTAAEVEENEILHHVEKSKARKLEMRPSDGGADKLTWVDKGVGPIWLLKNKTTGKTRVLLKVPPFGKPAVNFGLIPGADSMYRLEGMKGKGVIATFVDHMEEKDKGTKPTQWALIFGKEDDAKEVARILKAEQPK